MGHPYIAGSVRQDRPFPRRLARVAAVRESPVVTLRQELDGETIIPSQTEGRYLRLDGEGFAGHTPRRQKGRRWDEVSGFKPANVRAGTPNSLSGSPVYQIGFFLRDPPKKGRVSRWVVRNIYGVHDTLPGVYPDAHEIVALMERWRERHSTSE